jgi:hypothetical protein
MTLNSVPAPLAMVCEPDWAVANPYTEEKLSMWERPTPLKVTTCSVLTKDIFRAS